MSERSPRLARVPRGPRAAAALLVSFVLLSALARAQAPADARTGWPLGGGSVLQPASVEEGAAVLGAEDDFTRRMSPFDRQARLRVAAAVSGAEHRAFAARAVLPWNAAERDRIGVAVEGLGPRFEELGVRFPERVLLVKTSGDEEANAAYTRGTAVMLPQGVLRSPPEALRRLVCHELSHVLSRHDPALRARLYATVGFEPCGELELPGDLAARRITNPDAPAFDQAILVRCDGVERRMVPVLFARGPYDAARRPPFLATMEFRLIAVDVAGDPPRATALLDAAGEPILRRPQEVEGFFERTGRNTGYLIHPEEIVADNFVILVSATDEAAAPPPSPEVVARVADVFRTPSGGKDSGRPAGGAEAAPR